MSKPQYHRGQGGDQQYPFALRPYPKESNEDQKPKMREVFINDFKIKKVKAGEKVKLIVYPRNNPFSVGDKIVLSTDEGGNVKATIIKIKTGKGEGLTASNELTVKIVAEKPEA